MGEVIDAPGGEAIDEVQHDSPLDTVKHYRKAFNINQILYRRTISYVGT